MHKCVHMKRHQRKGQRLLGGREAVGALDDLEGLHVGRLAAARLVEHPPHLLETPLKRPWHARIATKTHDFDVFLFREACHSMV